MSESGNVNKRAVLVAGGLVSCLLVLSGIGYRVLAERLSRPSDSMPLPPGALARLPMQLGPWAGRDVLLEKEVVKATDTDSHINRQYSRGGSERVQLYVAYGVRARDLMPHRPEVCYPGAGWTREDARTAELLLGDGAALPCRILRFSRGGLGGESVIVLNYYIVDGKYCADVEELRSKAWWGAGGVRYMAQVQIACAVASDVAGAPAAEAVRRFGIDSARPIHELFADVGKDPPTE